MRDECAPLEGASDLLRELKRRGLTVVLASSSGEDDLEFFVDRLDARDCIDALDDQGRRRADEAASGRDRGRSREGGHARRGHGRRLTLGHRGRGEGGPRDDLRPHRRLVGAGAARSRRRGRLRLDSASRRAPRRDAVTEGGGRDLNPRPPGPQPGALPTELPPPRPRHRSRACVERMLRSSS